MYFTGTSAKTKWLYYYHVLFLKEAFLTCVLMVSVSARYQSLMTLSISDWISSSVPCRVFSCSGTCSHHTHDGSSAAGSAAPPFAALRYLHDVLLARLVLGGPLHRAAAKVYGELRFGLVAAKLLGTSGRDSFNTAAVEPQVMKKGPTWSLTTGCNAEIVSAVLRIAACFRKLQPFTLRSEQMFLHNSASCRWWWTKMIYSFIMCCQTWRDFVCVKVIKRTEFYPLDENYIHF